MSRPKRAAILIAMAVPYLLVAYIISDVTLIWSAMANGPCETNDCPEGMPPIGAWAIPVAFVAGFLFLLVKGVRWVVQRDIRA